MTMELHDAVDGDGLFDIQGKGFKLLYTLNVARLTTIPGVAEDLLAQFQALADSTDLDFAAAMEGIPAAVESWQSGGNALATAIVGNASDLLIEFAKADAAQPDSSLENALEYLIAQMETDGDYVDGNTVAISLAAGGSNVGDVAICYTTARGDGKTSENILTETIAATVTAAASAVTPTVQFIGDEEADDILGQDWPAGSGCKLSVTATNPANSLLSNGDFEDETIDDTPDNWQVVVGTPGTTLKVTAPEQQTVEISGTPTAGSYLLEYTNAEGVTRATVSLAYNAAGSAVQSALRAIPGLEQVAVSTSGTSPDYTHTITFTGVGGDPDELTSVDNLTGGTPSIAHATTVAGNAGSFRGLALEFDSDGAEATAIYHLLTVTADTVHFCHLRMIRVGAAAVGEMRVEIVDEIGGSVVDDGAGNANSLTIDVTALGTADHESKWFAFRVPKTVNQPVYLRIRISTAISNTASVFVDEVAIAAGRLLYTGGPYVAAFSGKVAAVAGDLWVLTVTNNRAGGIQEWYERCFDMTGKGLLLPVTGSTLIPNTVIS